MFDVISFVLQFMVLLPLAIIQLIVAIYRYRDSKMHTDPRQADFWEKERKRLRKSLWILGAFIAVNLSVLIPAVLLAFGL